MKRRRHHDQQQVGAQRAARLPGQRQAEIGVERAFVELVEDHAADAGQAGVRLQHPGQDAFGHHLDPGRGRDPGLAADPVADAAPDRLAQRLGHALGRGAGGEAARFQHDDAAGGETGPQQRQRHARGLAGAGRGLKHRAAGAGQCRKQVGQHRVDRQGVRLGGGVVGHGAPVIARSGGLGKVWRRRAPWHWTAAGVSGQDGARRGSARRGGRRPGWISTNSQAA